MNIMQLLDLNFAHLKAVLNLSVDFRSRHFAFRGRAGDPPRRFAPAGSPLPRTPAGVFVPSTPINRVQKSILTFNTAIKNKGLDLTSNPY